MRKSVIYLAVLASLVSAKASACDHAIVLRSSALPRRERWQTVP